MVLQKQAVKRPRSPPVRCTVRKLNPQARALRRPKNVAVGAAALTAVVVAVVKRPQRLNPKPEHQPMTETSGAEVLAYVALGGNLGDARTTVQQALLGLAQLPATRLLRASSLYRTAPLEASGPDFVNAVAALCTRLSAPELLSALQQMEDAQGRQRPYINAPRTLDLDILLYGDACINSPSLQIPHPRMSQRAFVLVPLAEIAPQQVRVEQLLAVQGQRLIRID